MKRFYSFCLVVLLISPLFAKEKLLDVKKTEWGFSISNVGKNGKRICTGSAIYACDLINKQKDICIVYKTFNDSFDFEKFAKSYVENNADAYIMWDGNFYSISATKYQLIKADEILVIFTNGEFLNCEAMVTKEKRLYLKLSDYSELSSVGVEEYIQKPIEKKQKEEAEEIERKILEQKRNDELLLQQFIRRSDFRTTDEYKLWRERISRKNVNAFAREEDCIPLKKGDVFPIGYLTYFDSSIHFELHDVQIKNNYYSYLGRIKGSLNTHTLYLVSDKPREVRTNDFLISYPHFYLSSHDFVEFIGVGECIENYQPSKVPIFKLVIDNATANENFYKRIDEQVDEILGIK